VKEGVIETFNGIEIRRHMGLRPGSGWVEAGDMKTGFKIRTFDKMISPAEALMRLKEDISK